MSDSLQQGSHHSTDSTPTSEHSGTTSPPTIESDIPEGLEPLAAIQSIHVQQQLEFLEIVFGVETENRYSIFNNFGQRIYFAGEKSNFCDRQCYGASRPFIIYVFDCFGKVVIKMERNCTNDLRCWGAGYGGTVVDVKSALTGELYGTVSQNCDCSTPNFSILDADGNQVLSIVGPSGGTACDCLMCGNAQFTVFYPPDNANGGQQGQGQDQGEQRPVAGMIMKQFGLQEFFSDANTFGVSFDAGLDPKMKAVLIGATFAIDFAFFEEGSGSTNNVMDNNANATGYGGGGYGRGHGRYRGGGEGGGGGGRTGSAGCSICSCVITLVFFGVFAGIVLTFIFVVVPHVNRTK